VRRRLVLALTWVAATLVAVFVALQAVGAVGRQVTDHPAALARPTTTTTAPSAAAPTSSTTSTTMAPPTSTTAPPLPTPTRVADPAGPQQPQTTEPAEQPPAQSAPSESEPPESSGPPATSASTAPGPTTTYNLAGGSIGVRCRGQSSIELVYSSPAPGFSAEVDNTGPQEVEVRFESDEHHSRIKVQCSSGNPVVIDEREED
jgi:hypothetical protein